MVEGGNSGYKCLKMLEPMCNNRLMKIAHSYRPKILYYEHFNTHIEEAVYKLSDDNIKINVLLGHVNGESSIPLLLAYYGSFRRWGHPFVNSLEGLKKLNERVNKKISVDSQYANALASDLARKVLESKFKETGKWSIDHTSLDNNHPFFSHAKYGTWPTPKQIKDFGDQWHLLPLIKCFEIPDLIEHLRRWNPPAVRLFISRFLVI